MQVSQRIAEKRREKRYELKNSIRARLYLSPEGKRIDVKILNISRSGLSCRTAVEIPETSDVYLVLNKRPHQVVPVWALPGIGQKRSLTYGFSCANSDTDLIRAFEEAGLQLSKAKEKFQTDEERFLDEFDTIEFEVFPSACSKP